MTIQLDSMRESLIEDLATVQKQQKKEDLVINENSREAVINGARSKILEITTSYHTQHDPYLVMRGELKAIINYKPTNKVLYVKDGSLEEYFPLSPIGPYKYGDDVIECIQSQVDTLVTYVNELQEKDQWIGLRLAQEVIDGMKVIIADYDHASCYSKFDEDLISIQCNLKRFVEETANKLNGSLDRLLEKKGDYTVFDLWELPAESYPASFIRKGLSDSKWIQSFLVESVDGRIPKEALRDAMVAIASDVSRKDIDDLLISQGKRKFSKDEWIEALNEFRTAPNGLPLLEYFGIPVSTEKFEIDDQALDQRPYLKSASPQGSCEMAVLADIESAKWWQTTPQVYMSEAVMYDQLNTLFQNPYEPQLFHTDKYLSFLTVAATSLAYLDFCNQKQEAIEQNIVPLVFLLEDIADHAHKMYPKEYVEKYKSEWLTLIGQLKSAVQNPQYDPSTYYLGLFSHPDQNLLQKRKALTVHCEMRPSEYLARKVGYWNKYYLTNNAFLDDDARIKYGTTIKHRTGTLFSLLGTIYEVTRLVERDGFICQICLPVHWDAEQPVPLKVVYQGTIPNRHSEKRDTNPIGPGYGLWKDEGTSLLNELVEVIRTTSTSSKTPLTYDIEFSGHSLGGSDAQNAASYFSDLLIMDKDLKAAVNLVNVHTFNPAGIPESSSNQFYTNILSMKDKLGKIRHSMVKNDLVEASAQNKLGANFKDMSQLDIMETSNLGVYHIITNHCLYAHSATDTILPHKLLDPKDDADARAIHRYLFGVTHSWKDLTGHTEDMIEASPIAKIAFNSLYLVGLVFGLGQIKKVEEAVANRFVSPLIKNGVTKLESAETSYLNKQMRDSIHSIWQAFTAKWRGTQILEGTG